MEQWSAAQRSFRLHFNLKRHDLVPPTKIIKIWVTNFEETDSALKKKPLQKKTTCTPEKVAAVMATLIKSQKRFVRKHALSLNLISRSLRRILHSDLNFHPYKMQIDENENFIQNISENGDIHWPLRSHYLLVCDFFFWGYLKSKVYAQKPRNIDELKTKIKEEIASTPLELIHCVVKNVRSRLEKCLLRMTIILRT
ncbi:Hypothetical protein CINCED_3A013376 [Cinara cedri]|uniref:DUF4817 domain-containing protein n=1 Tax=Cinara cedri TaxID=506608 RepID=A0A5E4N0V2_9HEMI|nr:Hypothetical protein CINCED_3A013376 [Cinara cedri]